MMPIYGLCDFDSKEWRNYHRYGLSMFSTNFDPEFGARRWYFYGGAVDGTAYIANLGGSVTKDEMKQALRTMIESAIDRTGSLFWWPKGRNKRRCITRCSQGQGSWVVQGTEQWLGLRYNAVLRELDICPRGLLCGYSLHGIRLGSGCFDVDWHEDESGTSLTVCNRCNHAIRVKAGARPYLCGVDGDLRYKKLVLNAGETARLNWTADHTIPEASCDISAMETQVFAPEDIFLDTVGLRMPSAEQETQAFLLRYALLTPKDLHNVRLRISVPKNLGVCAKPYQLWMNLDTMPETVAEICVGDILANTRAIFPFFIRLPDGADANNVWKNGYAFAWPKLENTDNVIYAASSHPFKATLKAELYYEDNDGSKVLAHATYLHGVNKEKLQTIINAIVYNNVVSTEQ